MKKILLIIIMLLFTLVNSKAIDVTRNYELKTNNEKTELTLSYDSIYIAFPSRIYMHYIENIDNEKINIKTKDPVINNMIEYKLINNTLYFYMKNFGDNNDIDPNDIIISLYKPNDVIIKTSNNLEIEHKNKLKSTSYENKN